MNLVSETIKTDVVLGLVEPSLVDLGYEVVRVRLNDNGRPTLQLMIDRADGDEVGVEDCTIVSRTVSVLLDVADPITNPYELEVSSPGLDRPLTRAKDFQTYSGSEVRVELKNPVEGRRRYRGRLIGLEEGFIKIVVPLESVEREFALPFEAIEKAKIVLTDKLLADLQRAQNKQG